MSRLLAALFTLLLAACVHAPEAPRTTQHVPLATSPQMVATAHPLATEAALQMLERGGSAIDAAIAAQMVLGLVEPQSSGPGGGSVVMLWDAGAKSLRSFDGLATAPSRVPPSLRTDPGGSILAEVSAQRGGRSVGVPGTLPVLKLAHEGQGKLPWSTLFGPAIAAAENGFPIAPYLHRILSRRNAAANHSEMVPLFFGADGKVLPVGTTIRNPEYAQTLRRVAASGPAGFLEEGGAQAIVAAAQRGFRPSFMTEADLRNYRAIEREPLCAPFIVYRVCTMGPPSFGGVQVLQILQMVELLARGHFDFDDPDFAHLYLEASKLAFADRGRYADDPDHVAVPARALVSAAYARARAGSIDLGKADRRPRPGTPPSQTASRDRDEHDLGEMTSQIAVADRAGNAVAITTTINLDFGARIMVGGFVLNNAMNVFSDPVNADGTTSNRMAPGKRPSTSMAPVIAFDAAGRPVVVGGAAGGRMIPDYVASTLVELLGNGCTPTQALGKGHISAAIPGRVRLETRTPAARLAPALKAKGHVVEEGILLSGLAFLKREEEGWIGAADPRRDGTAAGSLLQARPTR